MMKKPPRFYDPARPAGKSPTEKQRAARDRNWRIFKIRGLYYQSMLLTGAHRIAALAAVDGQLRELGAEPETERRDRLRREAQTYEKFRAALVGDLPVY